MYFQYVLLCFLAVRFGLCFGCFIDDALGEYFPSRRHSSLFLQLHVFPFVDWSLFWSCNRRLLWFIFACLKFGETFKSWTKHVLLLGKPIFKKNTMLLNCRELIK